MPVKYKFDMYTASEIYLAFFQKLLEEDKVHNILDLGTGNTTRLCYKFRDKINYKGIDDNREYMNSLLSELNNEMNILCCDSVINETVSYYKDLLNIIGRDKYDLISVDGPFGFKSELSRTNIIDIINAGLLNDRFYILIHDTKRRGERNLISRIYDILNAKNIEYYTYQIDDPRGACCISSDPDINRKLTVYCCYHDKLQIKEYNLLETDEFKLFYGPGDPLNKYFSEFSMLYYIWKNDKDSAYIGTCHYRRILDPGDFSIDKVDNRSCICYEIINSYVSDDDIKNNKAGKYGFRKWTGKDWMQCEWLYKDFKEYTIQKYGEDNKYLEYDDMLYDYKVPRLKAFMIPRTSFILTRKHFMNMCDFLFGFIDYIDNKYNLNKDPELYDAFIINRWFENTDKHIPFCIQEKPNDIRRLLAYALEVSASLYVQVNMRRYKALHITK